MQRPRRLLRVALLACIAAAPTDARADEAGVAYGFVGAELATGGAIAIHHFTASSPGEGIGLAVNFLPVVVGIGAGLAGEAWDLDARPPLAAHGAVIGALPLLMIGASVDGRGARDGVALGPLALTLGALGAAGGAYLGATRVETTGEAIAVGAAPFAGAFVGGLAFAVAHFFDDRGPRSTGRLVRFAGVGMLAGTVGSYAYAFKHRDRDAAVMRRSPAMLSLGGTF